MDLKILQICHKMPYPPTDGGSQSMHFTAKGLLSNGIAVKTLAINPTRNFVSMDLLPADYIANNGRYRNKTISIFYQLFQKRVLFY